MATSRVHHVNAYSPYALMEQYMTRSTTASTALRAVVASRTSSEMLRLPLPDRTRDRLREHARHGAAVLGVVSDGPECVWGFQGSSLSFPVRGASGVPLWMKLRSRPVTEPHPPEWSGVAAAERALAGSGLPVLRPVLSAHAAWTKDGWAYQAEVTSRLPVRSFSPSRAAPDRMADLPEAWWDSLRTALDGLQELPAAELDPVSWQEKAARSIGAVDPASWVLSHGDVCAANLGAAGGEAVLFDWDYIGRGPRFADAASLLISSLDTPDVAARVKAHFGDQLDSPEGLYAQSVVAAHWSKRVNDGEHIDLGPALRAHMRLVEERICLTAPAASLSNRPAPPHLQDLL
ncbi:phosphotransferase [Streptomyces sp. BV129]|uniref:phosphotransferase family protein n=1 Tax=Streptomyces sp. BV129 TaxID=2849671 RepID=UPI001C2ED6DC|nr:phosphotransferase [Streptomyces sp. BV129]MBV1949126.1 aminoglycoside phosphotransferase family protein [Streptomyces sp. BV129]